MIYCKKCGTELQDESKFCNKCGAKVEQAAATGKGGNKYWGAVLGIILFISGVLTLGSIDFDFTSTGAAVGYAIGTLIKVAIPVGGVAFIIWLIKRKKK